MPASKYGCSGFFAAQVTHILFPSNVSGQRATQLPSAGFQYSAPFGHFWQVPCSSALGSSFGHAATHFASLGDQYGYSPSVPSLQLRQAP